MAARNIDELVGNIISHPSFQETLNNVFRALPSTAEVATARAGASSPTAPTRPILDDRQQFNNAQEEFSSIFRRGNSLDSRQRFPRGRNIGRNAYSTSIRRPSSVPATPYTRPASQGSRRASSQNGNGRSKFRLKEVILLADSRADQVVRANQKALLMDRGHVLNDLEMDKNWTEEQVLSCLEECFHEILQSISKETPQSSSLRQPCLQQSQTLNGASISRLFAQKVLWMRPLQDLPGTSSQPLMTDIYKVEEKDSITCLEELCPNKSSDDVMAALETANGNINEAAQYLLGEQPEQIFSTDHMEFSPFSTADSAFFETGQEVSIQKVLKNHAEKVIDTCNDQKLEVEREEIWRSCLAFYKMGLKDTDRLKKNLFVEFIGSGEQGIDCGALKLEFFNLCMEEARLRLFEGDPNKLIPRRGIGSKGIQFEIAGALIAHSVLQGGPGFPYLAEWFVDLLFEDETSNTVCLISKDDIPKNAMTEKLFNFVEKLDSSINQQAIEEILDNDPQKEAFWEIINASEWSSTEAITMQNKALLIQELITNELMQKRMYQVISFRKGLAVLNFFPILKKHKDQAKTLLCYQASVITAEQFKSLLLPKGDQTHAEKQAYTWFLDNIQESEGVKDDTFPEGKLNTILKFVTGLWTVPPTRESLQISVEFLEDDDTEIYPKATACAAILRLPTVHSSRNGFFTRMDQGLSFGHAGFAEL